MKVNLLGATGAVGSALLKVLIQRPDVKQINVIGRSNINLENEKLIHWVHSDLKEAIALAPSADIWFCALGTTIAKAGSQDAFDYVDRKLVLEAGLKAKSSGAKQFHVVSALGANPNSKVFYNRVKGQMQQQLDDLNLPSLQIYQPSLIDTDRKEERKGERIAIILFRAISWMFVGALKRYKSVRATDIALFMSETSKNAENGVKIWYSEQMQPINGRN